jgi:hippurate hydrolase
MTGWRQHLHAHPELDFGCHATAEFVAARLREFGITQIEQGIAQSGIVAVIEGQGAGPTIGLRADMDALPITEATGLPYASKNAGVMHACGHDGHTTMLLGAAKYLAETRNFAGRVALIFQPAEESSGGAKFMVDEGIMQRYDISQVYALHTSPGDKAGRLMTRPGPLLAAVDTLTIQITGRGGHGAFPEECADPVVAACGMVQAIQTIVSRNLSVRDDLVISVTQIHTGTTDNVIPETAWLNGTIRTFEKPVQEMVFRRLEEIVAGQAAAYGVRAELDIEIGYPPTVNHAAQTAFAVEVAREIAGDAVDDDFPAEMGAEDFAYMLEARPGAYLFLGQGEGPGLHHEAFNFNDEVAPVGASFLARLVERAQPIA